MPALHDVFVAFAGPDRELAKSLVEKLLIRGLTVRWEGHLLAEQKFTGTLPNFVSSCLVFAVVVSPHTWNRQHYAAEELAAAVALARSDRVVIVPLWTESIAVEDRPDGIRLLTGITLSNHADCLDCVAGLVNEAVLRRKLYETQRELSEYVAASSLPPLSSMPTETQAKRPASRDIGSRSQYQSERGPFPDHGIGSK